MEKVIEKLEGMEDGAMLEHSEKGDQTYVRIRRWEGKKKHVEDEEVKEMKRELRKLKKEKSQAHVEQRRFKMLKNRIEKIRQKIRERKMKEKS